ncbi:hypothetical protein EYF80_003634 [Liparis tanakae]|uniref:Uncharacterized protein n=1 Tax=Liparis tanakae TaxID=230148 RepID=A0A4Z2J867_9TELE|nr:hypothetical protein EYF80_003634 [Liparis tanakae]
MTEEPWYREMDEGGKRECDLKDGTTRFPKHTAMFFCSLACDTADQHRERYFECSRSRYFRSYNPDQNDPTTKSLCPQPRINLICPDVVEGLQERHGSGPQKVADEVPPGQEGLGQGEVDVRGWRRVGGRRLREVSKR